MEVKALSLEEMKQRKYETKYNHIWVKIFHQNPDYTDVVAAILDFREPENEFVAIWNAEPNEKSWLWERTYGTEWLAYSEEPPEDDDYDPNVPPVHLNGMW